TTIIVPGGMTFAGQPGIVQSVTSKQITVRLNNGQLALVPNRAVLTDLGKLVQVDANGTIIASTSASQNDVENYIATGNANIGAKSAEIPAGVKIGDYILNNAGVPVRVTGFDEATGQPTVQSLTKSELALIGLDSSATGGAAPVFGPDDLVRETFKRLELINTIKTGEFKAETLFAEFVQGYNELVAEQDRAQKELDLKKATTELDDNRLREIAEANRRVSVAQEAGRRANTIRDFLQTSLPGLTSFAGQPVPQFTFNDVFQSGPGQPGNLAQIPAIVPKSAVVLPDVTLNPLAPQPEFPKPPQFVQPPTIGAILAGGV
ncbi:MAG: hypothetical protein ACE5FA_09385, partial [Dehalococcoidia bacterium]